MLHNRPMHTRALLALVLLAAACAKAEPAAPITPAPESVASAARAPEAGPMRLAAPDAAAPEAAAPDAAPAAAALDARCTGAKIDLTAILLDAACIDGSRGAESAPSLRVTASALPHVAPGAEGIATVTFTNDGAADVDLHIRVPLFSDNGPGFGFGPGGGDKPKPPPPRAVPGRASTKSADGKRSFDATWSVLTAISTRYAHVRIAPGGAAELRVAVAARGFLPGKTYEPSAFDIDSPPDALPVGRYKVTLRLGIATGDVAPPVLDLDVRR
jgi:hypothetical protein